MGLNFNNRTTRMVDIDVMHVKCSSMKSLKKKVSQLIPSQDSSADNATWTFASIALRIHQEFTRKIEALYITLLLF